MALAIGLRVLVPGQTWTAATRTGTSPAGRLARGVLGAALAVAVLVLGYAVNPSPTAATSPGAVVTTPAGAAEDAAGFTPDRLSALADYLRQSGAVFYGAYWCPHCQAQKQMFGAAASKLPYVECDPRGTNAQPAACQAVGVQAYPTWVINGQKVEGEVSPSDLARLSGFGG
jgi:thiol-disulfide isomerase/thioredoxin